MDQLSTSTRFQWIRPRHKRWPRHFFFVCQMNEWRSERTNISSLSFISYASLSCDKVGEDDHQWPLFILFALLHRKKRDFLVFYRTDLIMDSFFASEIDLSSWHDHTIWYEARADRILIGRISGPLRILWATFVNTKRSKKHQINNRIEDKTRKFSSIFCCVSRVKVSWLPQKNGPIRSFDSLSPSIPLLIRCILLWLKDFFSFFRLSLVHLSSSSPSVSSFR